MERQRNPPVTPGDVWEIPTPPNFAEQGWDYYIVFYVGPAPGPTWPPRRGTEPYARCFCLKRFLDGTWETPTLQLHNLRVRDGYFSKPDARHLTLEELDWLQLLES